MTFIIASKSIEDVVQQSLADGNSVVEVSEGWTKVRQVVYMRLPMAEATRKRFADNPSLRYWLAEPTPHNRAEEGFTDDVDKVSIAFPLERGTPEA